MTHVRYGLSDDAWNNAIPRIQEMITAFGFNRVIEIGGGANPTLTPEFVAARGLEYTLLDISQVELDKAPAGYMKVCADICADDFLPEGQYDFAFSRMLAEHVPSGEKFHRNIHSILRDGGHAFHFFPTLFAPPFVVNALLPEAAAEKLLHLVQPGRESAGKRGKFPAHYSWCRGPLRSHILKFEGLGYEVDQYLGFFGHAAYYQKIPVLARLHLRLSALLSRHPIPALTSFAQIVLIKREPSVTASRHAAGSDSSLR